MIRNFISYYMYIFRVKKIETIILITDCVLFLLSVYTLTKEWPALIGRLQENLSTLMIITGIVLKFLYDVYKMIDEMMKSIYRDVGTISQLQVDLKSIKPDPLENEKYRYDIIKCRGKDNKTEYIMNSNIIDQHLISKTLKLKPDRKKEKQIGSFIKANADILLPFLKTQYRYSKLNSKLFYNERKLCLSKDIDDGDTVTCHKGWYYDTYLTNGICGKLLKSNKDNKTIVSAEDFFPVKFRDNKAYLKSIANSVVNNEIGISTLAITSDNYLVLWTQNMKAQASNDLLVPTGSGSCDWKDRFGDSFNEVIANAMKRELWEESGGKNICNNYLEIGRTMILGYFRWVTKAGKPEFVGLTKVNFDINTFIENKKEVYRQHELDEFPVTCVEDLETHIKNIKEGKNVSVPLFMNLVCLERYCNTNKEELAAFIGI